MSYSQLPVDVIHEILEDAPDFATLSAATRISKTHHEVFKAHPKSIVRAVAENVVGYALHSAARLADYHRRPSQWGPPVATQADPSGLPDGDNSATSNPLTREDIFGLPDEDHFTTFDFTKSPMLIRTIERDASAVRTLRDFYSQRRKDRTSLKSMLEPQEALRFDRAMYRFWLWLEMVQENAVWKEEDPSDNGEDIDQEPEMREEFVAIVKSLSSEELLDILHIFVFAAETRLWRTSWTTGMSTFYASSVDPASLARSLTDVAYSGAFAHTTWDPIHMFIKDVLLSRNLKPEQVESKISSAIVTTVVGAGDKCYHCQAVRGRDLLGTQNMFLLTGLFPIRERISLLPGLLPRNGEECKLIEENILRPRVSDREKTVFHEMVDLEVDNDAPAEEQWSKDEWYCLDCIKELYRQRFLPWWKKTRQGDGSTAREDCWYGYNCRTMTHKPAHASKLGHLCEPTRGVAPNPPAVPPTIINPTPVPLP